MVTKHLTDEELQQYAMDKPDGEEQIAAHIHICEDCKARVRIYQLMIAGIKQQPQPAFDFDLSTAVLKQLPTPQPKAANDSLLMWILIFVCVCFAGTAFYSFRSYLGSLFEGVATIFIFLIAISAITVIALLFFEMNKKYQEEMKILDLY